MSRSLRSGVIRFSAKNGGRMKREIRLLRYVRAEDDPDCYDEDETPNWFYNFAEVFFEEGEEGEEGVGPICFKEFPFNLFTATGEEKALWILIQELQRAMQTPPVTCYPDGLYDEKNDYRRDPDPAERKEEIRLLTDPD